MWLYDTGKQPVHIPEMDTTTVLDGFIYPWRAVTSISPNGNLTQEIRGGRLGNILMTIKKAAKCVIKPLQIIS